MFGPGDHHQLVGRDDADAETRRDVRALDETDVGSTVEYLLGDLGGVHQSHQNVDVGVGGAHAHDPAGYQVLGDRHRCRDGEVGAFFTQQRPHACCELLGGDEYVLRPFEDGYALRSECDTAAGALEHTQPHIAFGCAHACADCLLTESELAAGGTHAAQARNRDHHIERSEVGHPG